MSDKAITEDLMSRLKRHYIKPGVALAGGVFVPEVGFNGRGGTRRCDALYVGFTTSSAFMLVGHEVKASRADWLRELDDPSKSEEWASSCHQWWIVAAPGVVKPEELREGWGLMVPGRSRTRMEIKVRAVSRTDVEPWWDVTRSVLARMDTLHRSELQEYKLEVEARVRSEHAAEIDRRVEARLALQPDVGVLTDKITAVEQALGIVVENRPMGMVYGNIAGIEDLRAVGRSALAHRDLRKALARISGPYGAPLVEVRQALAQLESALADLASVAQTVREPGASEPVARLAYVKDQLASTLSSSGPGPLPITELAAAALAAVDRYDSQQDWSTKS